MLIIIPGWMHDAKMWHQVSEGLQEAGVKHAVLDIPGFGTVDHNDDLKTFNDLVNWSKAEIEKLIGDEETITLVGHSCGGRVALDLVANDVFSIDKVLLTGSPNLYRPSQSVKHRKLLVSIFRPVKWLIPLSIRKKLRSQDYEQVKGSKLEELYHSVFDHDQTDLLAKVTIPTYLLWGADDTAAPIWIAKEMQTLIPNSNLELITGAGHNLHLERPQLLTAKIVTYINETD